MASVGKEDLSVPEQVEVKVVGERTDLVRRFSLLSCLGMAFAMLNSWTGDLSLVLPSGGSISMVWGLAVSTLGTLAMCVSLAEVCHIFPAAGGQYDWAYLLAPARMKNGLGYFVGWMATAGWVALPATGSSLGANFIVGIISLWYPDYEAQRYQTFLIYMAFTIGAFLLNMYCVKILPFVEHSAFIWSLVGIVVVIITLLACQHGDYQSGKAVFATFTNQTGWPDGMAFILGLLQSVFGLTGFDAVSHLVEEMPRPSVNAPKVMIIAVLLGASTSWVFTVVLLLTLTNVEEAINSAAGPLLEIYYQAVSNRAGATCLVMFNVGAMAFATQGLMTVASRMVMTLARDQGVGHLSPWLSHVSPRLEVPTWSIIFTTIWVIIFGLICIICFTFVSIPAHILVCLVVFRGNKVFADQPHKYSLGRWRKPIGIFAMIFLFVTSICFVFPPFIPVTTGTDMNYVIVVVAMVVLLCAGSWFTHGRTHYHGPWELEKRVQTARML
ncbi:amino acid permease [Kockovaella imperatae]|uniref:Amino acid permease n=1 Tax=Kockovaella imperatae TaxID=4999 RepID=A0A1Y1UHG8_9TREE|nr:amino acid permease [Kockovaella imperatae]ORX37439.1 amino acid permease [Kockovaella imperatae]